MNSKTQTPSPSDREIVTMRGQFPSAEERNRVVREYKADVGAEQHLGRLDSYLTA